MGKARHPGLLAAAGHVMLACTVAMAAGLAAAPGCAEDDEPGVDPRLELGRTVYAQYCAMCHGAEGEGYESDGANALAHPLFLATASDELLHTGTARGRPGTPMSSWGVERGGPLDAHQVDAVVALIRSWQSLAPLDVERKVSGDATRGLPLWEFHCAHCHGSAGQGVPYMSVMNPEFLAVVSDGFLHFATAEGRSGTPMPGFDAKLTAQGLDDLVYLIRSWEKPIDDTPYEPPTPCPSTRPPRS